MLWDLFDPSKLRDQMHFTPCFIKITLKNFRPISLCNTSYKIITKIISKRLRLIMDKLIGPHQTSFLKKRQPTDNAIIVQEIINHLKKMKGKLGNLIMKINLEKAFDKLEWSKIHSSLFYIKISTHGPSFSLLFFADDLVLMSKATLNDYCKVIKVTLGNFCEWSGQNINNLESKIIFSNNCSQKIMIYRIIWI